MQHTPDNEAAKKPARATAIAVALLALSASACQKQEPAPPPAVPPAAPPAPPEVAPVEVAAATSTEPQAKPPQPPPPIVITDAGFETPESVLYDEANDVYLVSNINGSPTETDQNGFISKVAPDGKVLELKWIDGSKPGVHLNAPKGMAIQDGLLYVADITFVRLFELKTGAPKGKVGVSGSTFVNDIAPISGGGLYVSDSGVKLGKEGFEPTGTDGIYLIEHSVSKPLIKDKGLQRPNGLLADDKGVWVVTMGSNELYRVSAEGKKGEVTKLPKGGLDGLIKIRDGALLISSWEGSAVYKGKPGGTFEPIVEGLTSPADIGYDSKRDRLLIPLFQKNTVEIRHLSPVATAPNVATAEKPAKPAAAEAESGQPGKAPAKKPAAPESAAKPAAAEPKPASKATTPNKPEQKKVTTPAEPEPKKAAASAKPEQEKAPAAAKKPTPPAQVAAPAQQPAAPPAAQPKE